MKRIFSKKAVAAIMTATVAVGAMSPMAASASTITDDPTTTKSITSTVPTVAAHRAAETAVLILGGNLITTDGVKDVMLDTFGSDYNLNPNQYLYNYRVKGYSEDHGEDGRIHKLTATVAPTMADLYGGSLDTNADIYLGNAANSDGDTYDDSVNSLAYNCTTIEQMEDTMEKLAAAIDAEGTGLYGTASTIATKYVNYIEKTEAYVISKRDETKKIAVLSKSGGTYYIYTASSQENTSINRAAEYLSGVTDNLAADYVTVTTDEDGNESVVTSETYETTDDDGNTVTKDRVEWQENGTYIVNDLTVLTNADVIITTGFQQATTLTETDLPDAVQTRINSGNITLFNTLPLSSYGIYMNSAENALGMVALIMAIYEEDDGIKADCEDAVAYYYSNFYHISNAYIDDLANEHFKDCKNYSGITEASVASDIATYAAIVE